MIKHSWMFCVSTVMMLDGTLWVWRAIDITLYRGVKARGTHTTQHICVCTPTKIEVEDSQSA